MGSRSENQLAQDPDRMDVLPSVVQFSEKLMLEEMDEAGISMGIVPG